MGKSTLFHALTEANTYIADQLFATLDPTFQQIELSKLGKIILVDTVGFIRDLPHELVAAFRVTLEEAQNADLLLHVIDSHSPTASDMIEEVQKVLERVGSGGVPQLYVYNKIDLQENIEPRLDYSETAAPRPRRVWVSALRGEGLALLRQAHSNDSQILLLRVMSRSGWMRVNCARHSTGWVLSKKEKIDAEGDTHLTLEIQRKDYQRLADKRSISG